ncbi:4-(cytidine 5'-diphospho)-2-C-methyl-D-erythritol kinase [Hymenobacter sp. HMF4947]|uniref:4-diphosphocytidyl-2-C-methyl-D-erythritol kinase n=1 Tax=Hymenobacter ginkgonis TaxID=2682976 RepID=A0A7K1TLB3_9BACT|nr:4-(cytidine 5'-diphospho)-2-C-methyl-D-erythritol kinase [Hymenobacter ginkgonis]MVN79146.1 4-(cytidine 5'-diphospho)-2-C-methyl-D-erythritol kinase [Hymenobacter ginkgonis]
MLTFPNAKLNLGLHIIAKRPDGYHELETSFVPLPWADALEVLPTPNAAPDTTLALTGRPVPGALATNLCLKAYALLKADFPALPAAQLHLHKVVPIGAGLGGGSADAAFALRSFNDIFGLQLAPAQLATYARRLGADCAFFLENTPVLATGKGDEFEPLPLDLRGTPYVVVWPGVGISTAEAYRRVRPQAPQHSLRQVLAEPLATWRGRVVNDFEEALAPAYPVLAEVKQQLYAAGAAFASLSGSGSAVFGLWERGATLPPLSWPSPYAVWQGLL